MTREQHEGDTRPTISDLLHTRIERTPQGIEIGNQHFVGAIGVIGGATALEALELAMRFPTHAVIVFDPNAELFTSTLDRLARREKNVFSKSDPMLNKYPRLRQTLLSDDAKRKQINQAFAQYTPEKIAELRKRCFAAKASIFKIQPPDVLFDHLQITYPEFGESSPQENADLLSFFDRTVAPGGTLQVITDIHELYLLLLRHQYKSITHHGRLSRKGSVNKAVSIYDITNGLGGFWYVDMLKIESLSRPAALTISLRVILEGFVPIGLARHSFGRKKVNYSDDNNFLPGPTTTA